MIKKLLLVAILLCSANTLSASMSEDEIRVTGKNAIMMMGKTLKKTMMQHMKSGGPKSAANFCVLNASGLEKLINERYPSGVSVKRISAKPRSSANATTDSLEVSMLAQIEKDYKDGKKIPPMIIKKVSQKHHKVFKPLFIDAKCIACHGMDSARSEQAYAIIKAKYPHDKAIGYKAGDFRGFIVADIIEE